MCYLVRERNVFYDRDLAQRLSHEYAGGEYNLNMRVPCGACHGTAAGKEKSKKRMAFTENRLHYSSLGVSDFFFRIFYFLLLSNVHIML
jgi:hypothetical protein